jgi:hypothetical protein
MKLSAPAAPSSASDALTSTVSFLWKAAAGEVEEGGW